MLVLAALLVVTTACGTSDPARQASPTTGPGDTHASPATTQPDDSTRAVLAAYQLFWRIWLAANNPPNPNFPGLAQVAVNPELATARASIESKQNAGDFSRLPAKSRYRHDAAVRSLQLESAIVDDCAVDDIEVVHALDDSVVNNAVETQQIVGYLFRVDGTWRVSNIDIAKRWSGASKCE